MSDALFPEPAARRGRHWDLDADSWDHRQTKTTVPTELRVTGPGEIGRLYSPDGRSVRVVRAPRPDVPFGFRPKDPR